jgi:hypothetical protein
VASLQGGWVGLATALSPATAGHFKFLLHHFFVGLGLIATDFPGRNSPTQIVRESSLDSDVIA